MTPDQWTIDYAVTKRRAGHAPEGSGAPVGTEYRWLILAHQDVKKLNADDYSTHMHGLKFKIAHRSASTGKWSVSEKGERKRMIAFLREVIMELEKEPTAELGTTREGPAPTERIVRRKAVRARVVKPSRAARSLPARRKARLPDKP